MKITEAKFIKAFRKELESKGWLIFKINERFARGFPDLICMKDEIVSFFEIKSDKNKLTKLQEYTLKKMKKNGALVKVIRFKSQLDKNEPISWEEIEI